MANIVITCPNKLVDSMIRVVEDYAEFFIVTYHGINAEIKIFNEAHHTTAMIQNMWLEEIDKVNITCQ